MIYLSCTQDPIEIPEPDTTPPQAMILFPMDGESVNGEIIIQVRSVDNDRVDSVQFLINQEIVHTDSSQSNDIFTYTWDTEKTALINGTYIKEYAEDEFHYLSAIAYDPVRNSYASAPIRSKVDNIDNEPPVAFFLSPFTGQQVTGVVNIEVIASDNDSIQYVSYFINNILQGYVEEHPYIFPWNTNLVESGNYYSLHANVKDINNNTTTLAPLSIFVDNGISSDISPPTGAIVSPPAGLTISGNVNIIVSANDDRAMEQVALSINGEYITSIETEPYYYIWDTTLEEEDSEHTISVVLVDLAGNEAPLNPISVFVDNYPDSDTQAPTVVIMEPSAGQIIAGDIDIEVIANDDTGIDYIQFWINGEVAAQDSIAPYSYSWDTRFMSDDMEHIIAVAAFDFQGNNTLAAPIAVYVDNIDNILPSGNIQSPAAGQTVLGTIPISIFASDNHRVEFIELSIDGIVRDTLQNQPFLYEWDTTLETEDEDHVISAFVVDSTGNIGYISPISVVVDNETNDVTPPTGTIIEPISGSIVTGEVNFTVIAQDENGIQKVEFYINGGVPVYQDSNDPYIYIWNTSGLDSGSQHTLSATVTDNFENLNIMQPVIVTISN